MLTVEMLGRISENPDWKYYDLAGDIKALVPEMRKAGITTKRRVAAFLATIIQETDRLKTLEEYGGYSYWLYLDRMSGRSGEWRYHGRGYIMLTWRSNYERAGKAIGADLVARPDLLKDHKPTAAKAAVWYWTTNKINPYADRGEFYKVSAIVNTGSPNGTPNHYSTRKYFYDRALAVLPDGFTLTAPREPAAPAKGDDLTDKWRVVIPQTFTSPPTARRVRRQINNRVDLPPDKRVVVRDAGEGERVVIPQKFTHKPTALRIRDEIRRSVDLPPDKTVGLHKPRTGKEGPSRRPDRITDAEREVERAIAFGLKLLGAPYGNGWREGTWPALSSLYSRITAHDPAAYYNDRECICAGLVNILRFEVADLPSVGWRQGDGWPGGTAAIGRHLAYAPGSKPYPPVENTPRGWLVFAPYMDARLAFQGHVGVALGNGKVLEARVPRLSKDRTENEGSRALVAGGAKGYMRIIPPHGPNGWLVK